MASSPDIVACALGDNVGCRNVWIHEDDHHISPAVLTLIIFVIITIVYFVIVFVGVKPQNRHPENPDEENAEIVEFIGAYFGVICNLSLLLYGFLIYSFSKDYYYVFNKSFLYHPVTFGVIFVFNSLMCLGMWALAQSYRKTAISVMWTMLGVVAILVIGVLAVFVMRLAVPHLSKDQSHALEAFGQNLHNEVKFAEQQLQAQKAALKQQEQQLEASSKAIQPALAAKSTADLLKLQEKNPQIEQIVSESRKSASRPPESDSDSGQGDVVKLLTQLAKANSRQSQPSTTSTSTTSRVVPTSRPGTTLSRPGTTSSRPVVPTPTSTSRVVPTSSRTITTASRTPVVASTSRTPTVSSTSRTPAVGATLSPTIPTPPST